MTEQPRPLLLTADSDLLDDLLGLAAAVGVAVDVAVEPSSCRPQWSSAPLVLVGAELVDALIDARPPGRPGVLVVAREGPLGGLRAPALRAGAEEVVALTDDEALLLDRLADAAEPASRAHVIAVLSGRGGAGGSVLAAALALTAAVDRPSWLIDLDPLGGGADVGLGAELTRGARWVDLGVLAGRLSPDALREAVPEVLGVAVVAAGPDSAEPAAGAVRAVLGAAVRGPGVVVLDLPRHRTAARDEAVAVADELLVVVPAELRALVATRLLLDGLGPTPAVVRAVVRPGKDGLPVPAVLRGLAVPPAGELRDEAAVRRALLSGDAAGLVRAPVLRRLCQELLGAPLPVRRAA